MVPDALRFSTPNPSSLPMISVRTYLWRSQRENTEPEKTTECANFHKALADTAWESGTGDTV